MHSIRYTRQLRETLSQGDREFKLALQFGVFSRKTISPLPAGRFRVVNHIDNTTQKLTSKQLHTHGNIGRAMKLGAFVLSPERPRDY
ncbi:MAG TPA: hypothetical protein VH619_18490 [Verrucomicrobiae bacterium]|jgi:hypothetical protein|nr:hypothetical protein [Verrucomicrobiae bacterium]